MHRTISPWTKHRQASVGFPPRVNTSLIKLNIYVHSAVELLPTLVPTVTRFRRNRNIYSDTRDAFALLPVSCASAELIHDTAYICPYTQTIMRTNVAYIRSIYRTQVRPIDGTKIRSSTGNIRSDINWKEYRIKL